ncbi:MAG: STAS domain-containing protein [Planctomycetota bacterium]
MEIEKYEIEKVTLLLPAGDLVYEETKDLDAFFETAADVSPYVILDLVNTKYLSAKALGLIAFYVKHFRDKQGGLKLIHVNKNLKKVFGITGLLKVVEIFENEGVALSSFGPQIGKLEKMSLWAKETVA